VPASCACSPGHPGPGGGPPSLFTFCFFLRPAILLPLSSTLRVGISFLKVFQSTYFPWASSVLRFRLVDRVYFVLPKTINTVTFASRAPLFFFFFLINWIRYFSSPLPYLLSAFFFFFLFPCFSCCAGLLLHSQIIVNVRQFLNFGFHFFLLETPFPGLTLSVSLLSLGWLLLTEELFTAAVAPLFFSPYPFEFPLSRRSSPFQ